MTTTSRRRVVAAVAALAAVATGPSPVGSSPTADAELLALGRRFDALERQYEAAQDRETPRQDACMALIKELRGGGNYSDEIFIEMGRRLDAAFPLEKPSADEIVDAMCPVALRIMALRASTVAGLIVKARVARNGCSHFYDATDEDADWDHQVARHLIDAVLGFAEVSS